jgi:hypothetical protein
VAALGSFCIIMSKPMIWALRSPLPLPVSDVSASESVSVPETAGEAPVEVVVVVVELVLAVLDADVALSSRLRRAARSWLGLPAPYDPMPLMDMD